MTGTAGLLTTCLLLLLLVVPRWLSGSEWPSRNPALALLVWQATGLAGGLLALALCLDVALEPLGHTPERAAMDLRAAGPLTWASALLGAVVLTRLVSVLLAESLRTVRCRREHRLLLDLVSRRHPLLHGASVVDHDSPVAYCLPGLRPRVVLSRGMVELLTWGELTAVLDHERAHQAQRHDLVLLPFVALGAALPLLRPARTARREVALLVEYLADDRAARHHDRRDLARALCKIGTGSAPLGALGAAGPDVLLRARRLVVPPRPLARAASVALLGLAVVIALSPLVAGLAVVAPGW